MEKKFKNGLVLGKFLPPHNGHIYLIDSAIEQCDNVFVLACSIKSEPIPGKARFEALRHIYSSNPKVKVIEITDENPQYPEECISKEIFYNIWCKTVFDKVQNLDVVFTSEEYGREFSEHLKVEHVCVDLNRLTHPVSGTMVRNNYLKNINHVPKSMKHHFAKKVAFVGPESSGKSVMSNLCAKHFGRDHALEYGREYTSDMSKETREKLTLLDISKIAAGQIYLEEELYKKENLAICDTDLITTQIWSEIYFKECPKWIVDQTYSRHHDLYLLMDIDFDWVDDGTREFPEIRRWHFDRIEKELIKRGLNYKIISGSIEKRLQECVKEINFLLY